MFDTLPRLVLRICNLLASFFLLLMILSLFSESKVFFFICYFLLCGSTAIMALTFELSCELSFPVSENTTIAFLGLFGNVMNFMQSVPEVLILKGNTKTTSFVVLFLMLAIVTAANALCYKIDEKLLRSQEDKAKDVRQDEELQNETLSTTLLKKDIIN